MRPDSSPLARRCRALLCRGLPAAETAAPSPAPSAAAEPAAGAPDGGRVGSAFHTITITLAPARSRPLAAGRPQAALWDSSYRISFGSGVGELRSREQAVADLYREVRDRTGLGTHLAAEPHRLASLPEAGNVGSSAARPGSAGSDPLVDVAFQLIEAVDAEGEVTVDVAHGRPGCKLSLGAVDWTLGRGAVSSANPCVRGNAIPRGARPRRPLRPLAPVALRLRARNRRVGLAQGSPSTYRSAFLAFGRAAAQSDGC